jgi:hypothetical protein
MVKYLRIGGEPTEHGPLELSALHEISYPQYPTDPMTCPGCLEGDPIYLIKSDEGGLALVHQQDLERAP